MSQPSPHRHISFTAHYTGYIWYQLGLSHANLASKKGRFLAKLVSPVETWAERVVGGSMRTTLKQRHTLIDAQLNALIQQYPSLQVLEIACGLSPRGLRFRQQYPNLCYVEADLPAMADAKRQALSGLETPPATILGFDLFHENDLHQALSVFDLSKPLVIINEGLVNYFTLPMLDVMWGKLATELKQFPQGFYLTDIYPEPVQHKLANLIWKSSKVLKLLSRSAFSFHFKTPVAVSNALTDEGFADVEVIQPHAYDVESTTTAFNQHAHLGDLVWVIVATM